MNTKTTIVLLLLLATASTLLHAQAVDTIQPNPKAVLLKRIWMVRGTSSGGQRIGEGAAPLGQVVKDSLDDFAVFTSTTLQWNIYAGATPTPSTLPTQVFDSLSYVPAISGHFRQPEEILVGFTAFEQRLIKNVLYNLMRLRLHQKRGDSIEVTPLLTLDGHLLDSAHSLFPTSIQAADLNTDGYTDLLILFGSFLRQGVRSAIGEIWLYQGGPDFQVDSPTVILKDTEENNDLRIAIADFNADRYPDILLTAAYTPPYWTGQCKFFWGKPSLQQLSQHPDHAITLNDAAIGVGILPTIADLDGDSVADIAGSKLPFSPLFLSSSGKPISQRTFRLDDADQVLFTPKFSAIGQLGPLNDTATQRTMLPLFGPSPSGDAMMIAFSTKPTNATAQQRIDPTYDAYYSASLDGMVEGSVFGKGGPAGDVNGDGWSDYLTANPSWFGNDAGIAMILAGGPYIPRDDNTTSVRDIPADGRSQALSVWPNPVGDELNIAWRGDLPRMPQRFTIHDPLGRLVASGTIQPSIGAARWECGHVAAGQYLLTAYDRHGEVIATTTIIKQ
ncbi:MAG: VCBS repeat-containing protein [Chlorobi bacterium]|nr:MAG: FG-GAP repeat protein [Chlorobi bacterium OLB7]MBK8910942.1 VCBS repeat-containing protein [Chlorobiota bacterium]